MRRRSGWGSIRLGSAAGAAPLQGPSRRAGSRTWSRSILPAYACMSGNPGDACEILGPACRGARNAEPWIRGQLLPNRGGIDL